MILFVTHEWMNGTHKHQHTHAGHTHESAFVVDGALGSASTHHHGDTEETHEDIGRFWIDLGGEGG